MSLVLASCSADPADDDPKPVAPSKRQAPGTGPADDVQSLKREEIQAGVKRSLARGKRPVRARKVRCPLDVPAIKGQRTRCRATIAGGRRITVRVKITSVGARNIRYSIRTPPLPR